MSDDRHIIKVIKDFLTGTLKFADPETVKNRREICETCEARNPILNTCTVCNCLIKAKTKLLDEKCPMEKWLGTRIKN
jgi:hypothetical protein